MVPEPGVLLAVGTDSMGESGIAVDLPFSFLARLVVIVYLTVDYEQVNDMP